MDLFVVETVQSVLDTDANPAIRPMTYYVESPERITDLFDRIAYDKCKFVGESFFSSKTLFQKKSFREKVFLEKKKLKK